MSVNSGDLKQQRRDELQQLIDAYYENGGTISRSAGSKLTLKCTLCGHRRHVSMAFALQFKPQCSRCGGEANAEG
jgi:hypothetical protein